MPKLFLTPFVIAGLLFLPSCSSDTPPSGNQTAQDKSECDDVKKTFNEFSDALSKSPQNADGYRVIYLTQQYYLLEKQECFTAVQIASARAGIDLITSKLKP